MYPADRIPDPDLDPEGYQRWLDELPADDRDADEPGGAA